MTHQSPQLRLVLTSSPEAEPQSSADLLDDLHA
jgi:hypothetical protein